MTISTKLFLNILHVLCWIIFIGLCVEAGGFIFSTIYAIWIKPGEASFAWAKIDFSSLYSHYIGHFIVMITIMTITSILKAIMFYLIIKLFLNKKLTLSHPFHPSVIKFINSVASLALMIGFFSNYGVNYATGLQDQGIDMPAIQHLSIEGGDVWFFMSVVLFVLAQIFKRGIELQAESDLTI